MVNVINLAWAKSDHSTAKAAFLKYMSVKHFDSRQICKVFVKICRVLKAKLTEIEYNYLNNFLNSIVDVNTIHRDSQHRFYSSKAVI